MKYPVLLPNIFNYPFTYESEKKLNIGQYVVVPFGKTNMTGIIWSEFEKNSVKSFSLKKISSVIPIPPLNIKTLNFLNWFSEYNMIPLGMALKLHLLNGEAVEKFDEKKILEFSIKKKLKKFNLSDEQEAAFKKIAKNNVLYHTLLY